MSFYTYITRVLADMCDTWDAAGTQAVSLIGVLPTEKELDKAFDDIQSKADRADAIHAIPAFRLLQLEE